MKKIILAFDSFKGSVSSEEIENVLAETIRKELPDCEIVSFPIADGGEGTMKILCKRLHAIKVHCHAHDALMRPIRSVYAITPHDKTALIDVATTAGLPLLQTQERNPLLTSTYGVGETIKNALQRGCRKVILGLGGSATNDAGTGMLSALGIHFLNAKKKKIQPTGKTLSEITSFDTSEVLPELAETSFTIITDVNNPFCGPSGSAYIFSPQKGADKNMVEFLDKGLSHYGKLLLKTTGVNIFYVPGAGAAGGMGGGLLPFLRAELKQGSRTILELLHFKEALYDASFVLTGEGKIDAQTIMGKALSGILEMSKEAHIPVITLSGSIEDVALLNQAGFTAVFSIQPGPISLSKAMDKNYTLKNLSTTAKQIIRLISSID